MGLGRYPITLSELSIKIVPKKAMGKFRLLFFSILIASIGAVPNTAIAERKHDEIQKLIKNLNHEAFKVRRSSAKALGSMGPAAKEAIPALIRALVKDTNSEVRRSAASALREIGPAAKGTIPALLIKALENLPTTPPAPTNFTLLKMDPAAKEAIPALIKTLEEDTNSRKRRFAARALEKMGSEAKEAIPALIKALEEDTDTGVRRSAAGALGRIGLEAKEAIPVLIRTLEKDTNYEVRRNAAGALGSMGSETKEAIPALIKALEEDTATGVRRSAARALEKMGSEAKEAIPALIKALEEDTATEVRRSAAWVLGKIGPAAKEAIPALIRTLEKDTNYEIRRSAAIALEEMGPAAKEAIPALIKALEEDTATGVRRSAARALEKMGSEAKEAIPALIKALEEDTATEVRRSAAWALGTMGPEAKEAIPALIKALEEDTDTGVRRFAAWALEKMSSEAKEAIPALIKALEEDTDTEVRRSAARALEKMGSEAKEAIPALIKALEEDTDTEVRRSAAWALGKMGPAGKEAIPAFIRALEKDTNYEIRHNIAWALGEMGPAGKEAIPALIRALEKDTKHEVRQNATWALGKIGSAAKEAIPALIKALEKDTNSGVRQYAAGALGKIGPEAKKAIPALIRALEKDTNYEVRRNTAGALGEIGPEAKKAIPALIRALEKDTNYEVRRNATWALGKIGSAAKEVIPALIKALEKDTNHEVRQYTAWALREIGPEAKIIFPIFIKILKKEKDDIHETVAEIVSQYALNLQTKKDVTAINILETILKFLKKAKVKKQNITSVENALWNLKNDKNTILNRITFISGNPLITGGLIVVAIWLFVCFLMYWLNPLLLLRFNNGLKQLEFKLPNWLGGLEIPFSYILLVGFFHYSKRVLDAWVSTNIQEAREAFGRIETVKERNVYISAPVVFDGKVIPDLSAKHLRSTFARRQSNLFLWGEGGAGKTSLACQIARWAMSEDKESRLCEKHYMLPVFIEPDLLNNVSMNGNSFLSVINRQLRILIDSALPIPDDFLHHLLLRKRILVIVDDLSKTNEAAIREIQPGAANFPVNTFMATSRTENNLGVVVNTRIKPLRIKGNRLSTFMEAYLVQRGKRELFNDAEYFDACRQLSMIVRKRDITILLAKLYAELMISTKERTFGAQLPRDIPELMHSYINELNRGAGKNKMDDRDVHKKAKAVAWVCLMRKYIPTSATRKEVLEGLDGRINEKDLQYLEDRLQLIQTLGAAKDRIQFSLDPLAEYLAALNLVDQYGSDEKPWRDFFTCFKGISDNSHNARDFLLALQDCCSAESVQANAPGFVLEEMSSLLKTWEGSPTMDDSPKALGNLQET